MKSGEMGWYSRMVCCTIRPASPRQVKTCGAFIVPKSLWGIVLDGCHCEVAHQGQCHTISLMQEHFWWPGMTRDMINKVKNCAHCKKYEGAPPIAKLQKLPCSGPGELLHIDFITIKETVGLHEETRYKECPHYAGPLLKNM